MRTLSFLQNTQTQTLLEYQPMLLIQTITSLGTQVLHLLKLHLQKPRYQDTQSAYIQARVMSLRAFKIIRRGQVDRTPKPMHSMEHLLITVGAYRVVAMMHLD